MLCILYILPLLCTVSVPFCVADQPWVLCRVSLGSESGIIEFSSGKLRLHEVENRNCKWESGASRQHTEFPSWKNMAYDLEGKILQSVTNCVCLRQECNTFRNCIRLRKLSKYYQKKILPNGHMNHAHYMYTNKWRLIPI